MFDLPDSYFQSTEATDRVSQLMQYTLLTVLELEFQPIYHQNWWEGELKPHILQMDAAFDNFVGTDKQKTTIAKYRQLMSNLRHHHKVEPDLSSLDVTALSTVLLYDETYRNLAIRQHIPSSQKKYRSVMQVKNCRNGFSHGDVGSRKKARDRGLEELRTLMQLYDCSRFGPALVQEVFHYDPDHPSAGRQMEIARQQEFGRFYNSFVAASTQLEQPQTRQAALDTMRQLAQAGFRTAMGRVMDVVLHDPAYFNLKEAVDLLSSRNDLVRDEIAQLTLLRELQQKEEAAQAGNAAAAMEMARMVSTSTSPIYTPGREITYYMWAWQSDHRSGLDELKAAAQRGMTSAWDALCRTGNLAAMDWLADQLYSGRLPGGKTWNEISPWLFRLFDADSPRALAILAVQLGLSNSSFCTNSNDADRCRVCQRACEAGYLNVMMHRQNCKNNSSAEKRSETLALCQRLAQRDPDAGQVALAVCLVQGIGQQANLQQARNLIPDHLLTTPGNAPDGRGVRAAALYWAGQICEYGVPSDKARAADYYRKSAACGDFPMAGLQVFMLDAADHDPKIRHAAYDTLSRLEKHPTDCVRHGFFLTAYQNILVNDSFLRRNPWVRNIDYIKLALWAKWYNDRNFGRNNSYTVLLFIFLAACKTPQEILSTLRGWLRDYTPAAAQLEALYLLTQPQPDLAKVREAWNKAASFHKKPLVAQDVRDHGVFRSHGRKDRIAQALQTGIAPDQLYDLLKSAGFRIPCIPQGNRYVLMGVIFSADHPFYRWLSGLYLDRYEKERTALVAVSQAAKLKRIRWYETEKKVRRSGRPGLPDHASAVRLYLAEQGDAEAMQTLLDSRQTLTGTDRLYRNLTLADMILQGQAPGGHTAQEGRTLLMECLDHVPDSHTRAAVLCTLGRYETDKTQRLEWFRRAQNVDPDGLLPCAALIDAYLQDKEYRKAVQQADRFWLKQNLHPYRRQQLSTAWPSTRALLDLPTVTAWAVALGQKAYSELLQNDNTLTKDNIAALNRLVQMDTSVGDWHIYKIPNFFERLSLKGRIAVIVIGAYLLYYFIKALVATFVQSPGLLIAICLAVIIWLVYRYRKK